jgi:transcriptional regulator with XRE-family HTH domain
MDVKHYKTYIQIGLNILHYRKEQGITQEQLAEMIGYSRQQVQRVETANAAPTLAILLDISEALNVPLEKLLEMR